MNGIKSIERSKRRWRTGAFGAALVAAALLVAPRAFAAEKCAAVLVSDVGGSRFLVQPTKCDADPEIPIYGRVALPKGATLKINGQTIAPRKCDEPSEMSTLVGSNKAPSECFDWPVGAAGNLSIEVFTGAAAWQSDKGAVWLVQAQHLTADKAVGVAAAPSAAGVAAPPPPVACPAEATECNAYKDALSAANISATGKLAYDVWRKSPEQIYDREHDSAVLFFHADGSPYSPIPQLDEDDTVVVAVVSADKEITQVRVSQCGAADPLRIQAPESPAKGAAARVAAIDPKSRHVFGRKCRTEEGMHIVVTLKGEASRDLPVIPTLGLYRITVGLGLVYDFSHAVEFRASSVKGENVPVIVRDEHVRGLGAPIPFIAWRPVPVDKARLRRFWPPEWIGIGLGLSLTEPLDHLYPALLIEPYPGFGILGGVHFHTVKSLAGGYAEGDRFPAGEVPVDKRWSVDGAHDYFVGIYADASVFANLLKAIQ